MPDAIIASQNGNGHRTYAEASAAIATSEPVPQIFDVAGLFDTLAEDAEMRHNAKETGKPLGAVTSLTNLDQRLGGALMPGVHIVHGSPGIGKTAFALQIAAECQCPAMFVTCEMPPLELLRRIIARVTHTFLDSLKDGSRSPANIMHLARAAAAKVPNLTILDATQAPAKPEHIQTAFNTTRRKDPANPHALMVVDSLHSWAEGLGGATEEYAMLNEACASLRRMAAQFNVPILAISERNRASMGKGGQNSGAGSRKLEYSAETVIGLNAENTDDDGLPIYDAEGETEVKLTIGKNRHGSTAKPVELMFSGRLQSYEERY